MPIDQFHVRIGNSALLFMLIAGVWGLWRWRQHRSVDASYRGLLLVGELLLIAQGLVGAYMWLFLNRDAVLVRPAMHILYGILTVIALPAAFSFASGKIEGEREQALYAFVCLFLAGLVWRAHTTGVNVGEDAALTGAILLLAAPSSLAQVEGDRRGAGQRLGSGYFISRIRFWASTLKWRM
ncbi:MAG: hypothetical protein K1X65_02050 [Caldilineales bacterium]|nr:hypothetical protein [Caldilineales bacterium]MCW5858449.1 hypothetical protein [Caldilineales bacterium]